MHHRTPFIIAHGNITKFKGGGVIAHGSLFDFYYS
jgi:hypothetical protein